MAELFADSGDPDQTPRSAFFAGHPFRGLQSSRVKALRCPNMKLDKCMH